MRAASYCDVTLIYYSDTVSMDAFIITMALSARAIQHGAHRHDRRGIYRCVLLLFRGRIEIDHSYGLRCRGLCCHFRHSTCGLAGAAARRPAHSCCAGSGSTNHSSADHIVVNSYINAAMAGGIYHNVSFHCHFRSTLYSMILYYCFVFSLSVLVCL